MTYATPEDMTARFGEADMQALTDLTGSGLGDDAVTQAALLDSDEEINGYIAAAGYALPLPVPVPNSVKYVACDFARWRLYKDAANEQVRDRYKYGVRWCEGVASGRIKLVGADGKELPRASVGAGGAVSGKPATAAVVDAVFTTARYATQPSGTNLPYDFYADGRL